jgi:hypothetical protein
MDFSSYDFLRQIGIITKLLQRLGVQIKLCTKISVIVLKVILFKYHIAVFWLAVQEFSKRRMHTDVSPAGQ